MADWEYNTGTPKWGGPTTSGTRQRVPGGVSGSGGADGSGGGAGSGRSLSSKNRKKLLHQKRRLEALIPVVGDERAIKMRRKLDKINEMLGVVPQTVEGWVDQGNREGIDGVGAQAFEVEAPPGIGRLLKLPFYPLTVPAAYTGANPLMTTSAGTNLPSATNPTIILQVANGTTFAPPMRLTTAQISWAKLRVVGFEVCTREEAVDLQIAPAGGGRTPRPWILAKDLHVDGSANLFPQHEWMDTAPFNFVSPEYPGLRAYPLLERTKTASVSISSTFGVIPAGLAIVNSNSITFSCSLIVEVLEDEQYGSHLSGPYARGAALERGPHRHGELMVGGT
jgi:hypothetical protein